MLVLAAGLLAPDAARAQQSALSGEDQLLRPGANLNPNEATPTRPLVLTEGALEVYGGTTVSLTNGNYFQPITFPVGAAYGVTERLEAGAALALDLNPPSPLPGADIQMPRLYGRYELLNDRLAAEASAFIPLDKYGDRFAYRLELPFRFAAPADLLFHGAVTYSGIFGGTAFSYVHYFQVGAMAIRRIVDRVWGAFEAGLTLRNFNLDSARVPLGLAGGYEIIPNAVLLGGLRFPDIGTPADRNLNLLLVYTWDVPLPRGTPSESTPDIPL